MPHRKSGSDTDGDSSPSSFSPFDDSDDGEDSLLPRQASLAETKEDRLNRVFSARQFQYLESRKVEYSQLRKALRTEFALKIASKFIKHMEKKGIVLTDQEKSQVRSVSYCKRMSLNRDNTDAYTESTQLVSTELSEQQGPPQL